MSYHVTIVRTQGNVRIPIARGETESAIAACPDLRAVLNDEGGLDITVSAKGEASPLLVWQDGEIWTKNPEDETLQVLLDLAKMLGGHARVRGDELETYRAVGDTYRHPDDVGEEEQYKRYVEKAIRRRWVVRIAPVLIPLVGALFYAYCARR